MTRQFDTASHARHQIIAVLTKEKKNFIVDSFASSGEANPRLFWRITVAGDPRANQRLIRSSTTACAAKSPGIRELKEVVSGDRQKIVQKLDETRKKREKNGIEVVDVRLKRVDLPPEVSAVGIQSHALERERVA
ncbi:MAG: hypothetical protein U1F68_13340 [Gammaproteobacteria bacterium]